MRKRAKISYRLLLLLAVVMAVVPINYYSVSSEFQNARTDAAVINAFGFIRGSVQRLVKLMPYEDVTPIIAEIDKRYIFISKNYLLLPANQSYFEACDFDVITSYSIHYTKLYELHWQVPSTLHSVQASAAVLHAPDAP